MKTRILTLVVLIISLTFVSCKKNDDAVDLGSFDYDKQLLFGTWKITKLSIFDWPYQRTTATFNPDGTYSGQGKFGNGSGTYKLSGKRISCYIDGELYMWYDVVLLKQTTCELIAYDKSGSIDITSVKE